MTTVTATPLVCCVVWSPEYGSCYGFVCCPWSGVKRVYVVLSGLRIRWFVCVHLCISCRHDWMFALAIFISVCVDVSYGDVVCVCREFYWCLWGIGVVLIFRFQMGCMLYDL